MESFKPPGEMIFGGNTSENWSRWKQKLENFLLASEKVEKPDNIKIAILLNFIGDEGVNLYNTFKFEETETSFKDVLKKFDDHCLPQSNEVFERFKFFSCSQKDGQSIDAYLTELKTHAASCNFGEQETSLIRDRIVLGVKDVGLQERLLREPKLTLQKAVDSVRACELSRKQVKTINDSSSIDAINSKQAHGIINYNKQPYVECQACGRKHIIGKCPAYNKLCNKCKKRNHFAVMCKSKNVHRKVSEVRTNDNSVYNVQSGDYSVYNVQSDDSSLNLFIDSIHYVNSVSNERLKIISVEGQQVSFKLDTGAQVNILPLHAFQKLKLQQKLNSTDIVLMEIIS